MPKWTIALFFFCFGYLTMQLIDDHRTFVDSGPQQFCLAVVLAGGIYAAYDWVRKRRSPQ
jgi:hypothetical protein